MSNDKNHNHHNHHNHHCSQDCTHEHEHEHHSCQDLDSCPVCGDSHRHDPEEYLNRIEKAVQRIPRSKTKERMDRLVLLVAGTAAEATEHKDVTMLQICEVYLALRMAEETGRQITPEEGVNLFREISRLSGSGLTAKYGLEGLTKVEFAGKKGPGPASLVFVTCYGIGKVLATYFKLQSQAAELTEERAREKFKAAKAEAYRLI